MNPFQAIADGIMAEILAEALSVEEILLLTALTLKLDDAGLVLEARLR